MAYRSHVLVCAGTGCVSCGSFELGTALEEEIARRDLAREVQVVRTGCQGFCAEGPLLVVQPDEVFYCGLKKSDVPVLVEEHLLKGRPVTKLMYTPPTAPAPVPTLSQIPFFAKQKLVVLRNRGLIDPERIEDYIARDGYSALAKALGEMTAEQIIQEIKRSGLRGRGGGGFPTGVKWATCRQAAVHRGVDPVVVCNADEGDPGAFMDRSIIESDPHAVIEGMAIGARAIGASQGFVYIRHEYPIARERLAKALDQAREFGLLGRGILGTKFDFDISVVQGARRLRLRRVDGADGLARGQSRRAAREVHPHGRVRLQEPADQPQQRRDLGERAAHHQPGSGVVHVDGHGRRERERVERQLRHEGVLAGRQGEQHRPHRGADGDLAARDHLRHRRRHPAGPGVQGRADRRPVRGLPAGAPTSTCRWISTA